MDHRWTALAMIGVFGFAAGWVVAIDRTPPPVCPSPRLAPVAAVEPAPASSGPEHAADETWIAVCGLPRDATPSEP